MSQNLDEENEHDISLLIPQAVILAYARTNPNLIENRAYSRDKRFENIDTQWNVLTKAVKTHVSIARLDNRTIREYGRIYESTYQSAIERASEIYVEYFYDESEKTPSFELVERINRLLLGLACHFACQEKQIVSECIDAHHSL